MGWVPAWVPAQAGCQQVSESSEGPPSTHQTSQTLSLPQRIHFLEQYVTFRRHYLELQFDIFFQNNGSGVPGPSDWDVRLLAKVPMDEMGWWQPAEVEALRMDPPAWVRELPPLPGQLPLPTDWYIERQREIGIDRKSGVVAYRSYTQ